MSRRVVGLIAALGVTVLALVAVGGPVVMAQMASRHHNLPMAGCPFMGTAVICPMTALEHVGLWRMLLSVVAPGVVLLAAVFAVAAFWRLSRQSLAVQGWKKRRWRAVPAYLAQHPLAVSSDFLRRMFAAGVLHPKVDLAIVS